MNDTARAATSTGANTMINRRSSFVFAGALALSACTPGSTPATTLAQAQAWATTLSAAVVAAGNAYTGPRAADVRQYAAELQAAAAAFAGLGDVSTARKAALAVTTLIGQITGIIGDRLPPAVATYAPIGVAVLSAFIAALPPPAEAPAMPPAALVMEAR